MNFNHDLGSIDTVKIIDASSNPPLGGQAGVLEIVGDGAIVLPQGTTALRPATPLQAMLRFNTTTTRLEYYDSTQWVDLSTSGGTVTSVAVTAGAGGITVSGSPITTSGTIDLTLDSDLLALANTATTGLYTITGPGASATRTITGTAGNIAVTNGNGVSGNPTIDLVTVGTPVANQFVKITTDAYGRVTATTAVAQSDITGLVDSVYVNVSGDSMSGTLTMTGGATITGLPAPTNASDAVNKAYVDALTTGLTWKNAVAALANTNVNVASAPATIDGYTLTSGQRVLLTNQTTSSENGIYVFNGAGNPLTRATDADTFGELNGAAVFVMEGTTYADTAWVQTTELTSFTGQTWVQFSGAGTYTAGVGLDLTGNVFSVNLGAGITQLPSDEVGVHIYNYTGSALGFSTTGGARVPTEAAAASGDLLRLFLDGGTLTESGNGLKFRDSAALSVVGRDTNTSGSVVDIVAAADNTVLRRAGTSLGFGSIDLSQSATVGTSVLQTGNGGTGLNTIGSANQVLGVNSGGSTLEYKSVVAGTGISVTHGANTITINNTGVTSVALAAPSIFNVTGSPVTTTGTLTLSLASQTANTVFAAPDGTNGVPTFRSLVFADLPIQLYRESSTSPTTPVATGTNSVAIGSNSTASATETFAVGNGSNAHTYGMKAYANGAFATAGDAQMGVYVLRNITTNNTSTELFLDGVAETQRLVIPNNSVFTFDILVAARRTDATGGGAGYRFVGVIRKDTTAGSTTFVGTPSKTVIGETDAPWDANVVADTTNGSLRVNVVGENGKTVRWVATIHTTEVTN